MEKRTLNPRKIVFLFLATSSLGLLYSCQASSVASSSTPWSEASASLSPLQTSPSLQKKMLEAGATQFASSASGNLGILEDYGAFGEAYVARLSGLLSFQAFTAETIRDSRYFYNGSNTILVYWKDAFYNLKDAYRQVILSHEQILQIAGWQKKLESHYADIRSSEETSDSNGVSALNEVHGKAIALQAKTPWKGTFTNADSTSEVEVTIDWNFSMHAFGLNDFGSSFKTVTCLTSDSFAKYGAKPFGEGFPQNFHNVYRLSLSENGQDAMKKAIADLEKRDFVQAAHPSQA